MRFSRHGLARMRLHGLSKAEVSGIVEAGEYSTADSRGRPIFSGRAGDGRLLGVVTALEDPELVIAVFCEVEG